MKYKADFKDSLSVGYRCRIRNVITTMEYSKAHGRNKEKYGTKRMLEVSDEKNPKGRLCYGPHIK